MLIVVDVQNGFLSEQTRHIVPKIKKLMIAFTESALPIVLTRFINFAGSPFEVLIGWNKVQASPDTDIADELNEFVGAVIDKHYYTALTPELTRLIEENDWRTLVLCGIATEGCVLKTALDIFEMGLTPIVITDACASDLGENSHQAGLHVLKNLIGDQQIMSLDDLLIAV